VAVAEEVLEVPRRAMEDPLDHPSVALQDLAVHRLASVVLLPVSWAVLLQG